MAEQWYAIVFNKTVPKGEAPDPHQEWRKGQVYSLGTVVDMDMLPAHFGVVKLPADWATLSDDVRRVFLEQLAADRA